MSKAVCSAGRLASGLLLLFAAGSVHGWQASAAESPGEFHRPSFSTPVRGITLSTPTSGREWGWDVIVPTLRGIRAVGANWVAIHPYAWIRADGRVEFRALDPGNPPAYLSRPIREAHRLGLRILIKPHLGYWGSPFRWRGEIRFDEPEAWERFFSSYEAWIVTLARACRMADGFVVGTELDATVGHARRWRRIIDAVRREFPGPITYAANWSHYQQIPFWSALDAVGIQAYFPLSKTPTQDETLLRAAWRRRLEALKRFAETTHRPILLAELGYNRSFEAPVRPWSYETDGPEAEPLQALLLRIALEAVESEPSVIGVFLWKWFPEPRPVGRNFQLATPLLRRTIRGAWGSPPPGPSRGP